MILHHLLNTFMHTFLRELSKKARMDITMPILQEKELRHREAKRCTPEHKRKYQRQEQNHACSSPCTEDVVGYHAKPPKQKSKRLPCSKIKVRSLHKPPLKILETVV